MTAGDSAAVASAAHALKGAVGLFTKAGAFGAAAALERAARHGEMSQFESASARLAEEMTGLRRHLRKLLKELRGSAGSAHRAFLETLPDDALEFDMLSKDQREGPSEDPALPPERKSDEQL